MAAVNSATTQDRYARATGAKAGALAGKAGPRPSGAVRTPARDTLAISGAAKAGPAARTLDVKPQNQYDGKDRNACGTTSLAMVMDYFYPGRSGNNHGVIDKEIRRADLFSTPDQLASYAENHGLRAAVKSDASLADLRAALDKGLPVQVVIDPDGNKSDFITHFVVVEGYEQDAAGKITGVKITDPAGAKKYTLDVDTFMKRWSDVSYANVASGMDRVMITYAPKDDQPITGLDGVVRRANDIALPGNGLLQDITSNATPARTLSNGVSDVVSGAANLMPGSVLSGVIETLGGVAAAVPSIGGEYAQRGGQAAIDWGRKKRNQGGIAGELLGDLALLGGSMAKAAGWQVQKAGNAAGWLVDKASDPVKWAGDGLRKIFTGW